MFKIVETLEKGLKKLTIVPYAWEDEGELSWPKFCTDKLIQNSNSMPDDSWFRMRCKLKRNHLLNYSIAEDEMEKMLERSDTEQEETFYEQKKKRKELYEEDYNSLATNACSTSSASSPIPQNPPKIISQHIVGESEIQETSATFETTTGDVFYLPAEFNNANFSNNLEGKLDEILENQAKIINNQNQIMDQLKNGKENQMVQGLAKLEAMLDTIGSKISSGTKNNLEQQKENDSDICDIEQIDDVDALENLERKLADKKVMEDYMEKLGYVCGRKGNGNGINNCYILIDRLFTRRFMTLCSWAGGARDKKEKVPFKIFKNVINLFFRVVSMSDRDFNLKDCEDFFKNVIRNSTRRNQSAVIRNSAIKRRPKNLLYSEKRRENNIQNDKEEEITVDEKHVNAEDTNDNHERENVEEENDADVEDEN